MNYRTIKLNEVELGHVLAYIHDFRSARRKLANGMPASAWKEIFEVPPSVALAYIKNLAEPYHDEDHECASRPAVPVPHTFKQVTAKDPYNANKYAVCVDICAVTGISTWVYIHDFHVYLARLNDDDCVR